MLLSCFFASASAANYAPARCSYLCCLASASAARPSSSCFIATASAVTCISSYFFVKDSALRHSISCVLASAPAARCSSSNFIAITSAFSFSSFFVKDTTSKMQLQQQQQEAHLLASLPRIQLNNFQTLFPMFSCKCFSFYTILILLFSSILSW